jgi:two-component system cell cycle sensor histidine kinase/response regulator CckA
MTFHLTPDDRRNVVRIVALYSLFGALWIYLSDSALGFLFRDPDIITRIATYKGLLFIATTATLLYFLIGRYIAHISEFNRQLQANEARFSAITGTTSDGFYVCDDSGRFLETNQSYCRMIGYSREELLKLTMVDIEAREQAADVAGHIARVKKTGSDRFESKHRRKDGTPVDVEVCVTYLPGEGHFLVFARDINERKQAAQVLAESERNLRTLMELMPVGVACADHNGNIEYINQNFVERFGYRYAEIPTVEEWFSKAYPETAYRKELVSTWYAHIAECLALGTPVPPRDVKVACKDGAVRHVIVNTQVSMQRTLAIFTDITERESLQEELIKKQKLESIGILAGGIAHDFNNILTAILGNITFAGMFIEQGHKSSRPLAEAEKAAKRAAELAQQLLTFARGGQPVKRAVSLRQVIEDSVSLVLRGTNVTTAVEVPDHLPAIESDAGQMGQVFNNLIINAVQAMPGGGTITISAEDVTIDDNLLSLAPGRYVRVTCTDPGCGISPENIKNIFDPYFTTKAGGSGLGLASVHSIVNKHGGHISVSSAVGQGTTFELILPASLEKPAAATVPDPGALAVEGDEQSVLVMDDEDMIRDLAAAILEELGYRVTTCSSGEEAIDLYHAAFSAGLPFRAVIMDLTIPGGMGGKEAARAILDIDPAARLIVSSGYSTDPVMADGRGFGFCGAVFKPYSAGEIAVVLKEALNKSERT